MELIQRNPNGTKIVFDESNSTDLQNEYFIDNYSNAQFYPESVALSGATWTITMPVEESLWDRNLTFHYEVRIGGTWREKYRQVEVYTPYATVDDIRSITGIGDSKTDEELVYLERRAAYKFNAVMGQMYVPYYFEDEVQGVGSDVLQLSRPVLDIHNVWEDDELLYDRDSEYAADWEESVALTSSRYRLRLRGSTKEHRYALSPGGYFGYDKHYRVTGVFGHAYVPGDLTMAAANYIDETQGQVVAGTEGIVEFSNDAYSVKYAEGTSQGTGSTTVDSILAKYRNYALAVV